MPGGIIDMADMNVIFAVTDLMGIHRESVSVELTKSDPGAVARGAGGKVEIIVPESETTAEFAVRLRAELAAMGYVEVEVDEDDDDDD